MKKHILNAMLSADSKARSVAESSGIDHGYVAACQRPILATPQRLGLICGTTDTYGNIKK